MNSLRKLLLSTALSGALAGSLAFALPGAAVGASGLTPAMAMLTAYSRTLTDEVAAYEATYTGASHKMMFDQYGKLTFAPNNTLLQSQTLDVTWGTNNASVTANQIAAPDGTTTADLVTSSGTGAFLVQATNLGGKTAIFSFYAKRSNSDWVACSNSGYFAYFNIATGSVGTIQNGTGGIIDEGDGWYRCYWKPADVSYNDVLRLRNAVANGNTSTTTEAAYFWGAQAERVTHETTPRAYNATTSAAFYGYRCVYAPETLETSTTSITIGSGSSYTFGVSSSHTFAVGDVVQGTRDSDPDAWLRGYVTGTTSTTVTIGSYTFPGTAYTLPVLTNGSATSATDWSVIRSDGYLAEPAATNICTNSNNVGLFTKLIAGDTLTANNATSVFGTTSAATYTPDGSSAAHYIYLLASHVSGTTYSNSVIVENNGGRYFQIIVYYSASESFYTAVFDLEGGGSTATETDVGTTSGTIVSTSMKDLGNGQFRCTVTGSATGTTPVIMIGCAGAATGNTYSNYGRVTTTASSGFNLSQVDIVAASVESSPIVTAASSVARSADVASMTGANFSGWWNATEGTFVASGKTIAGSSVNQMLFGATDGSAANRYVIFGSAANWRSVVTTSSATQADISVGTFATSTLVEAALAYKANDINAAVDGSSGTLDTTSTLPTVTQLSIGNQFSTANPMYGPVKSILYFSTRESDAQLVTLTGG